MMPLILLAAALLIAPSKSAPRARLARLYQLDQPAGPAEPARRTLLPLVAGLATGLLAASALRGAGVVLAVPLGLGVGWGARWVLSRAPEVDPEPLRLAGGWDLLAACLRSGLPVAVAVRAVAAQIPGAAAVDLRTVADRLALGADPREAWQVAESSPVHVLARAACRSAHTGASLARVAEEAAAQVRASTLDAVAARGQRAGVLITGPLGLCFLPAFLALGVVPVVMGLASGLAEQW